MKANASEPYSVLSERCLNAQARGTRTLLFPPPRSSPQGRGRIVLQSSANPQFLSVPRAGLRVSLSFGERAGVRGKVAYGLADRRYAPYSRAPDSKKLRSTLSRREFLSKTAAAGIGFSCAQPKLFSTIAAENPPPKNQAQIAITFDLEMARNFPTWEQTHWDYEKGNLTEAVKRYAV